MVTWVKEEFENRTLGSLDGPHVMTTTPEGDGSGVPDARTFPAAWPALDWLTGAPGPTGHWGGALWSPRPGRRGSCVPPGQGEPDRTCAPGPRRRNPDAQPGFPPGPAVGRLPGLSPAWAGDQAAGSQRPVSAPEAAWIALVSVLPSERLHEAPRVSPLREPWKRSDPRQRSRVPERLASPCVAGTCVLGAGTCSCRHESSLSSEGQGPLSVLVPLPPLWGLRRPDLGAPRGRAWEGPARASLARGLPRRAQSRGEAGLSAGTRRALHPALRAKPHFLPRGSAHGRRARCLFLSVVSLVPSQQGLLFSGTLRPS